MNESHHQPPNQNKELADLVHSLWRRGARRIEIRKPLGLAGHGFSAYLSTETMESVERELLRLEPDTTTIQERDGVITLRLRQR